jgi:hypothetical protein
MLASDLIPSFLWELEHQQRRTRADYNLCRSINARMNGDDYYESEDADYDLEALFDALDNYAPNYFYFGSHPGDGADYGWWLSETFEEDFDGLRVSDLSEVPTGYAGGVLVVSDHGNMTLYAYHRNHSITELWALV